MMSEPRTRSVYRSKQDITYSFLVVVQGAPEKKTIVMYSCKLSYPQLVGYTKELREKGLITIVGNDARIAITKKGREFIKQYEKLSALDKVVEAEA